MKTIGEKFPAFTKEAVVSLEPGKEFKTLTNADINGKWTVFFWWPLDFTFVCPTEIVSFNEHFAEFAKRDANVGEVCRFVHDRRHVQQRFRWNAADVQAHAAKCRVAFNQHGLHAEVGGAERS